MSLSERPRLALHALARRHVVDGRDVVVIHDTRTGRTYALGWREWRLLACADGTRDLDGIALAAERVGAFARVPALRAFLSELDAAGLLEPPTADDTRAPAPLPPSLPAPPPVCAPAPTPASRPLEPLPDFTLACDGHGSCCRIYASVLFVPVEAVRARAALPDVLDGGARHDAVFLPERGAHPDGVAAVALVDGRCAYLATDGRCGIHAAVGAAAKPLGCRSFPTVFVDDGESVRVSVAVECGCVLASVGRRDGALIVAPTARVRGDLDAGLAVAVLAPRITVAAGRDLPRADVVAWSRRAYARPPAGDVAAALWALADATEATGTLGDFPTHVRLPSAARLRPWFAALAARALQRTRDDDGWRSPRDLARCTVRWLADAAATLAAPGACEALLDAPVSDPHVESFYLRAVVHGHQLVGDLPLVAALRDRCVRLLVARAFPAAVARAPVVPADPATAEPLALVEAVLRGHGLDAYVHDLP